MQAAPLDDTFSQLIHANKAMKICSDERIAFTLCRATAGGRLANPEMCLEKANTFLTCYDGLIRNPKCSEKYVKALDCLKIASKDETNIDSTVCA